jgi:hypothetical protein
MVISADFGSTASPLATERTVIGVITNSARSSTFGQTPSSDFIARSRRSSQIVSAQLMHIIPVSADLSGDVNLDHALIRPEALGKRLYPRWSQPVDATVALRGQRSIIG